MKVAVIRRQNGGELVGVGSGGLGSRKGHVWYMECGNHGEIGKNPYRVSKNPLPTSCRDWILHRPPS